MKRLVLSLLALALLAAPSFGFDTVAKYYATPPTATIDGTSVPILTDANGRLITAGTVAGTSVPAKAEDAAAVSGDTGNLVFCIRSDVLAAQTSASGDYGGIGCTQSGQLVTKPYGATESAWTYAAAASGIAATTTAVTIKTAGGAGLKNCITGISLQTATLGNATEFAIRDGAAGTVLWRTQLQTTAMPLTAVNFPVPLCGTAATLLEVVTLSSATGGVYFNAQGYVAP